jgi:hypothetical protein
MAANATTKIQVNYGKDGLLVNVYADNAEELEQLLTTVQDTASLLKSVGASIGRGNNIQTAGGNAAYAASALSATPVVDTPPFNNAPASTGAEQQCKHGAMTLRSGVNASGKAWKGLMCPSPKGAQDKCETVWVK